MLKRIRLIKYFDKTTDSAESNLIAFCKTGNAEKLHQFRIEVKKMGALIAILKDHPEADNLSRAFKPIMAVFKKSGVIRNLDVNMAFLKNYPFVKSSFLLAQRQLRDRKAGKFIAGSANVKLKLNTFRQKISKNLFDVKDQVIIYKFSKKLDRLVGFLIKNISDIKKLHRARKKMKTLLYTYNMLPKSIASSIEFNKEFIKKVESAIGNWHDVVRSKAILTDAGYANIQVMAKLSRRGEMQKNKLKSMIENTSSKFYK